MRYSLADCILRYHDPTSRRPVPRREGWIESDRGPSRAATAMVREEVAGIRNLLGEVSREWSDLLADVAQLKRTMRPEDLEEAFRAAGLSALFRKAPREPGGSARGRAQRGGQPTREEAPPESPEVRARILEILTLLRENLGETASSRRGTLKPAAAEVPKSVTMELAREVADRVRNSLTTPGDGAVSERRGPSPSRKVQLEDVSAMIDEITGLG